MICVVDFGSQTAHLIGRRLRELGVVVEYAYPEEVLEVVKRKGPSGIILSGGPAGVYESNAPTIDKKIFSLGIPILGICYGCQLMANMLGGKVESAAKEYGPEMLDLRNNSGIFSVPKKRFSVYMSHGDTVTALPSGFEVVGSTKKVKFAAIHNQKNKYFGVQFHLEAYHTKYGTGILKNFATLICGETPNPLKLDPNKIIKETKLKVGDKLVIAAVSGGVDSTVAAYLIGKAVGRNLIPVYVESGLMRPGTEKRVRYIFTKLVKANLVVVDAKGKFMKALKGITDPERKRKAIGKLYVEIFQEQAKIYQNASFLAQGTIYSDVIESKGSKHASHIKSHHNVGGLPESISFKLLEPLRTYYKDEVRQLGKLAGLPEEVISEQPFPGPGYAVRVRGEVTPERLNQVKMADKIVLEEIKAAGLYGKVFQCFAVMSGAYSTAVKGDGRVFAEVVAIRAYESEDIMTSQVAHIPYQVLQKISSRIVNEVPNISRVVYDITTKPPATMEWE